MYQYRVSVVNWGGLPVNFDEALLQVSGLRLKDPLSRPTARVREPREVKVSDLPARCIETYSGKAEQVCHVVQHVTVEVWLI